MKDDDELLITKSIEVGQGYIKVCIQQDFALYENLETIKDYDESLITKAEEDGQEYLRVFIEFSFALCESLETMKTLKL